MFSKSEAMPLSSENVFELWVPPQGPTTLVSLLFMPMTTQTTWPVPSAAHEGVPTPVPPIR